MTRWLNSMSRRRFIADEVNGNRAALVGANAAHLARVLRARVGQEFDIAAEGRVRRGTIISVTPDRVEFTLGEELPVTTAPKIGLVLAIFKFDRMEWAIEKATELGVAQIVPVIARRTDAHLVSAAAKRVERWRRIVHEAAQQSRRIAPPELAPPLKLAEAVKLAAATRIVLSETETELSLKQALANRGSGAIQANSPSTETTGFVDSRNASDKSHNASDRHDARGTASASPAGAAFELAQGVSPGKSPQEDNQPRRGGTHDATIASPAGAAFELAQGVSPGTGREKQHQPRRGGTPNDLLLAIGPEGGWADDELQLFSDHGWTSASLGNTILRAETAAIVALAIALSDWN
jgi:16S rRNA (uracil1498-N3)-methyltransferase